MCNIYIENYIVLIFFSIFRRIFCYHIAQTSQNMIILKLSSLYLFYFIYQMNNSVTYYLGL